MRFVMFKGERTVSDLARRLFRIQGRGSHAAIKHAADFLLKANPQLKDIIKVPAGSIIAVPDTAPPVASEEESISVGLVRSFTAQYIRTTFDALQKRLTDIETAAMDRAKSAGDRMETPEMKAALKSVAGRGFFLAGQEPNLDAIAKDTAKIVKQVQEAQDARKKALTHLRKALASFAN